MTTNSIWQPANPHDSKMWHFMLFINQNYQQSFDNYQQLHVWSIDNPEQFWQALCDFFTIDFMTPPNEIINKYQHPLDAIWFHGATFNFAQKLLQRNDNYPALISINENDQRKVITYQELRQLVSDCRAGLQKSGVTVGDRVAAVLPNIDIAIIAMLATASLGAIWSSCSVDFGAQAIIDRFTPIAPKVLFICNGHQYSGKIYDATEKIHAINQAITSIQHLVIYSLIDTLSSDIPHSVNWQDFLQKKAELTFAALPFAHPLYIVFSSGTTGTPKCIVHGAGGTLLQHIKELGLHCNVTADTNMLFYTTCGWMMWNWMVSTLAFGATLTLYDGSPTYNEPHHLLNIVSREKISIFGTSAKFLASLEKHTIALPQYNFDNLKIILSTGSPLLPQQYDFVYYNIKTDVQLSSISGGTDILSCFALGNPLLPVYRGELQCVGLGMAVTVFNERGQVVKQHSGELVCTQAFPSMPIYFWHDHDKKEYFKAYFNKFPNVWTHGDFAELTEHYGVIITGRSDTVLNPGGVRIGTAEIYRQVEQIPEILESVAIGQQWQNDIRIVLFVKLQPNVSLTTELKNKIRHTLRVNASPRHVPAIILQVPDIPRTLNGKIVELAIQQVIHNQPITNQQSLANPEALEYFKDHAIL